jgi:D-alanyl-lipoteichoic acid acyltransferase DltB (MBOAT superfamily)
LYDDVGNSAEVAMVFSSYRFIFMFFPIVFAGYRLSARYLGAGVSKAWLVGASLCFYAQGNPRHLPLLVFTMLFNYGVASLLSRQQRGSFQAKALLGLALAENLGILLYYKYFNFFVDNLNAVFRTDFAHRDIPLPLGISFYTFLLLSYVLEIYRGSAEPSLFLDFAAFTTFFPHLIVGPIPHHDEIVPQFHKEGFLQLNSRNVMLGTFLFSIGCAEKVLLADPLISNAQHFYNVAGNGNFFEAWGAVVAYTFAYFFDFSGYIDMALGLGLMFNVKLPYNFESPYKAKDFADFWRRWNITVSRFFYNHVFRNIYRFGNPMWKLILATMATFLVSGLWHGAGWHFIFWGAANGVLVCVSNLMTIKGKKPPASLAWAVTFFFVLLTRVLFDSNSMAQAAAVYKSMLDLRPLLSDSRAFLAQGFSYIRANMPVMALILIAAAISFFGPSAREISESFRPRWYHAALAGTVLAVSLFFMGRVSSFLYFQF